MSSPSMEDLVFLVQNHYDIIIVAVFTIGITIFLSRAWRGTSADKAAIPGQLGLPFLGETFSFISATNSTRGCHDFVKLRHLRKINFKLCTSVTWSAMEMSSPSMEDLVFLAQNHYDIIIVAVLSIGITIFLSKAWRGTSAGKAAIPGRLGLPFLGETFSFLLATNSTRGCYDFVRLRHLWYGKWFKTRIYGKIHVFLSSTNGARTIFTSDHVRFSKGFLKSIEDAMGEKSVLYVSQESHKRIRRLLSDPFSMDSLSTFVKKIDSMVIQRLKTLEESGKSFSVLDFSTKMNFDAMCNMLISVTDNSLLLQIETDCTDIDKSMLAFPVKIPGTRYYKGIKARRRLNETFREMIARRRNGIEFSEDFLQSMLQRDAYPQNEKLDDSEIIDNLITLLIAGKSTTATAIMWCVKFLDENREAQDRLREEQLAIARKKPERTSLTMEDVNRMSYGLKVVKETLRMSNVVLWFPRVAHDDCTIDGFEIKKGWLVNIDAASIHYDPNLYKDPMRFNPSRFDETQKPYSFIPFGSGPRTCLGLNMARVTMLVFLHRLTTGYTWTVDDLDSSLKKNSHIPQLRSGCPITLKSLKNAK